MKLNKLALFVGLGFAATACGSDGGNKDPETEGNATPTPDGGTDSAPDAGGDPQDDSDAGGENLAVSESDPTCYVPDAPFVSPFLFQAQVSLASDMSPEYISVGGGILPSEENGNVGGYVSIQLVAGIGVFADGIQPGTYSLAEDPTNCALCISTGSSSTGNWVGVGGTMTIETVALASGDTFKASTTGVTVQGFYYNEDDPEVVPILKENCTATLVDLVIEVVDPTIDMAGPVVEEEEQE